MTRICSGLLLIASLLSLTGCINLSFGSHRPPPSGPAVAPSPPAVPLPSTDVATMAEIDAAARLSFESARKDALIQLAQRPALSPAVQVHLINITYRALSFDNNKVELLRAVIANPAFCDAARQAIVTQLDHISFDSNRQEILRRLNQRVTNS